jgi:hypothetical protein
MIDKIRLAFGIILATAFVSALAFFLFEDIKQYKYYIKASHGSSYTRYETNSFTTNGNCIVFKHKEKNTITLCGSYTIITK